MKTTISKSKTFAILVEAKDLVSLKETISNYYRVRNYNAGCIDGTEIEFSTLDELLSFENLSNHRIKSISIKIENSEGNYIGYVDLTKPTIIIDETCSFRISDTENAHVVSTSKKIDELLADLKQWYSLIRKLSLTVWLILLFIIWVVVDTWYGDLTGDYGELHFKSELDFDLLIWTEKFYLLLPIVVLGAFGAKYLALISHCRLEKMREMLYNWLILKHKSNRRAVPA